MRTFLKIVPALAIAAFAARAQNSPMVSVTGGKVQGSSLKGGAVFKGIPFAAPPVGDLRWREPAPVKAWTGVRQATQFGARCMQNGEGVSEDCLYLNVWTPEWPPQSPKPVMLWIHGGGNFAGASSEAIFDGEPLAEHGVVLVSANYRLGVFGFYAHQELTAESSHHASGNYGLMDQIAALKWVRENIRRFGGDPGNVTIFGESAGSLDINVLMTSPLAKGLFARLIGESGPVVAPPSLAEGEKKGMSVAASLHAESLKALRAVPATDLQKATGQGLSFLGPLLGVLVDGWVLPKAPFAVFQAGQQQRADLLLGSNARELSRPFFPVSGLKEGIAAEYGPLASRALQVYHVKDGEAAEPDPVYGSAMAQWATDSQFRCGTVAELIWHSRAGNTAYQFQFSRVPKGRETAGAAHGSELPYVFGTLSVPGRGANPPKYDTTDQAVSGQMQQYWTNFAKTGNPNGHSLPQWPKFDPASRAYMDLTGSGPIAREGLRREACDLFIENVIRK
ncbi:MAG: carboxylesterase family protein [Terriglobia bacterium]|nr:MAG: carboxylesterase family protein [Terriglobia bacterium]